MKKFRKNKSTSKKMSIIKKEMTIGDIVLKYPDSAEIMLKYGLHCIGCHVNAFETIEQGAQSHGMADKSIDKMIKEINEKIAKQPKKVIYTSKNEPIMITENALSMIKALMKKEKKGNAYGIRIEVMPGGCSGFTYNLSFDNKKSKDDKIIKKNGLKVFIDKLSFAQLSGSKIDFVETENGSGFKIDNPNMNNYGCH